MPIYSQGAKHLDRSPLMIFYISLSPFAWQTPT